MKTPAYYRDLAERSRRLAGMTPSQEVSAQLLRSADEFARLADELENSLPSAPQPVEQQQQQAQQQQVQPDAEKKD